MEPVSAATTPRPASTPPSIQRTRACQPRLRPVFNIYGQQIASKRAMVSTYRTPERTTRCTSLG